jgi:acyl carrier protein
MDPRLKPVIDWLRLRVPDRRDIGPDLDLIEHRVVDSLAFMEFVLLLEDVAGREFSREEIDVDRFRTLRAIDASLFGQDP